MKLWGVATTAALAAQVPTAIAVLALPFSLPRTFVGKGHFFYRAGNMRHHHPTGPASSSRAPAKRPQSPHALVLVKLGGRPCRELVLDVPVGVGGAQAHRPDGGCASWQADWQPLHLVLADGCRPGGSTEVRICGERPVETSGGESQAICGASDVGGTVACRAEGACWQLRWRPPPSPPRPR